jgi:TonB family protein
VRSAGFDRVPAPVAAASSAPALRAAPIDKPVEVVFKPEPDYTDDAKARRVEGIVTLEVEFAASGDVRVLRVVRGLGHGLDEAAARAAQRIRFRPAEANGNAVDCRATVHISFRLS